MKKTTIINGWTIGPCHWAECGHSFEAYTLTPDGYLKNRKSFAYKRDAISFAKTNDPNTYQEQHVNN